MVVVIMKIMRGSSNNSPEPSGPVNPIAISGTELVTFNYLLLFKIECLGLRVPAREAPQNQSLKP